MHLLRIPNTAKTQSAGAVVAGRHQKQLAMLVIAPRLREVPDGALGLVIFAAAEDGEARVLVGVLVGPLPHVAGEVHHAEGACPIRMRIDGIRPRHGAASYWRGNVGRQPLIAPRELALVGALR